MTSGSAEITDNACISGGEKQPITISGGEVAIDSRDISEEAGTGDCGG